jgi:hypothetical protein
METKINETKMSKLFDIKENGQIIYWTKNYDVFIFLDGNRYPRTQADFSHIKELKSSIELNGWWKTSHIIVNKNMQVMDGQYRIWALKELLNETGISYNIGFVIDNSITLREVQIMNSTSRKWTYIDFASSYSKSGNKSYQFILEMYESFKFPFNAILTLINNGEFANNYKEFKDGKIVISPNQKEKIFFYATCIEKLSDIFPQYKTGKFISALTFFLGKDKFNFDEFLHKVKLNRNLLYPVTTRSEYKLVIQRIYNYKRAEKITFIQE